MAGRSISTNADAATVAALQVVASRDGTTTAKVTASSLRLYLALPAAIQAALHDVDVFGSPEDKHNLTRAMARAVAAAQYDIARRRLVEEMQADEAGDGATDADLLEAAVRVTTQNR